MKSAALMKSTTLLLGLMLLPGALYASPESYTVDPRHTYPRWSVSHHGFSIYQGQFNKTIGKLIVDWKAQTGSVDIEVDSASIGTGDPEFDKTLRAPPFFNTDKHPKLTYRGTSMRFENDVPVAVSGDLTLLGVTRPFNFIIAKMKCGEHPVSKKSLCGAEVTGTIRRSEFGMKASLPSIGDDVRLVIEFEAFKD